MYVRDLISIGLLCVFLAAFCIKLLLLYRRSGIDAAVLGRGGKKAAVKLTEGLVGIVTLAWGAVSGIAAVHLQAIKEEKHLEAAFGAEYESYRKSTPRYLFF